MLELEVSPVPPGSAAPRQREQETSWTEQTWDESRPFSLWIQIYIDVTF